MFAELQYKQNLSGTYLDLTQFQGLAADNRNWCRNCQKAAPFYGTAVLKASHRNDGTTLVPPRELEIKSFCALCGWMYAKAPISKELREAVRLRDESECVYCGLQGNDSTFACDHQKPESEGGATDEWNLCWCCKSCNSKKGRSTKWHKPLYGRFRAIVAFRKYIEANLVFGAFVHPTEEYLRLRHAANARGGVGVGR